MVAQLPVTIETLMVNQDGMKIDYPAVVGLENRQVQDKINQAILNVVQRLMQQQYSEQGTSSFIEMTGTFELKTNERHVLSLSLSNYAYAEHHAHGLTLMKSLTFDTKTGKTFALKDLFKSNSHYTSKLSKMVKNQIKDRDIPIINSFSKISKDQDFYIADKSLVLYFQLYEITPHYVGFPMFPISVYALEDMLIEKSPLGRLLVN